MVALIHHTWPRTAIPKASSGFIDLTQDPLIDRVNLENAIDQLPDGYKKMLILHDIEGYQHNGMSRILGCSVGNSKSQPAQSPSAAARTVA
jgi:RNA polymerase sigma-70 factor (ECF subfamily)